MKKVCVSIALACLTALSPLFAQSAAKDRLDQSFLNDLVHKSWTTADGLPGMQVTALMQDKKGYIYIGTYDGLVRFDGVEFVTFNRTINPKYDFVSVRAIFQDSAENLWVGHNDEGVTCICPTGEILRYTTKDGLPLNSVRAVCEDFDGNIWIGTAAGICYLTPEREIRIPDGLEELGQQNMEVMKLYCDTAGRIWITTGAENDLFVWSNRRIERFTGITKINNPSVRGVMQDKSGAFWFGVAPHYAVRIKDTEETVFNIGHDHQKGTAVDAIMQDVAGNYWFATEAGVTIIHNGMYAYYDKRNGLSDDGVTQVLEDAEGNIWLAMNRGGIEKISHGKFRTVHMDTGVNAICEDPARHVTWLGADDGLYCYRDNGFVENDITRRYKGLRVRHVGVTADGELLVSAYSEDLSQACISAGGRMRVWTPESGLPTMKCRVAIKNSAGDYYVGTTKGLGIIHADGSLTVKTKQDGFENEYIMWLFEDKDRRIWTGTDGGGVYVLKDEQIVAHYTTEQGLAGNIIFKIGEYDGAIWITTGSGVSRYVPDSDSFQNLTAVQGLGSDSIFQMIGDYTKTVWMTSNKGILSMPLTDMENVMSGKKKRMYAKRYGPSDGLMTAGVTSTSLSMEDSTGRLWFTLVDGFAVYDPTKSGKNKLAPKIDIQEYVIDDEVFEYHDEKIILPPSARRLSIKYTGLSFVSPENIRFSFKLSGFDSGFNEWTSDRQVSYTNIKPGSHVFTVRAVNSDGVESGQAIPVGIVKQAYIWQLLWFWILAVLALFLVCAFIAQRKVHAIRLRAEDERRFANAIIGAFANCVDGKDEYTNGHSLRVAQYTKMLARKLGETDSTIEKYYNIALLHDIGKIGVPDAILKKPAPLDSEERPIMQHHADRGYAILKDVRIQDDLAAGAHFHHERYDGKGYPLGLKGDDIPWVARIIAVADTFDAMSSTRPYRKRLPLDYIINEIDRISGSQLDPKVVDAFMELYREGAFDHLR
ncbi:MAG: HD domain-containing protein [Treponema sp.]|nr:HD domain-containing protein [Treponema sp.]